ncbi:MAG TPA: DNA repair protein RecO [Burkholderiales bacterium]|nr:DNA repair protein RecO [Burkholderiales bacterium]
MKKADRIDSQEAFILHAYPFRETSLIVEAFSKMHGRVALVARGARRPMSSFRGLLLSFQPLHLSWYGKSELRTLHGAERQGGRPGLRGMALICGLYLNELVMRLLPRDDPHEALFSNYAETLSAMMEGGNLQAILRRFEVDLLNELGYAPMLENDAVSGEPLEPERVYTYELERGPAEGTGDENRSVRLLGKTLLDMASGNYSDPVTQQQSKALMRMLINHHIGAQPLHTRRLLQDLQSL